MADISRLPQPQEKYWNWQQYASCRGVDSSLFFHPENERGEAREVRDKQAKILCASCRVRAECAAHALALHEPYGVWGGMSEGERASLRGESKPILRKRNSSPGRLYIAPKGTVRRYELSDRAWSVVAPVVAPSHIGRPARDRRQVLNGILWKLSTGETWREMPTHYGPWKTVYEQFRRWSTDGTWRKLLHRIAANPDIVRDLDWSITGGGDE